MVGRLVGIHAEEAEALALLMMVVPVDRLVQVDKKVDPDANIPVRLRLSLKDGEHSHIHLLEVVPVPLLKDHAPVLVPVHLLAPCDAEPMDAQRYSRKLHFAMSPMVAGELGLMGPVLSVGRLEP